MELKMEDKQLVTVSEAIPTEIVESVVSVVSTEAVPAAVVPADTVDNFIKSLVNTKETAQGPSLIIESIGSKEIKDIQVMSKALSTPLRDIQSTDSPSNVISEQLLSLKVRVDEINPGNFDLQPGFFGRMIQKVTGNSAINKYMTKFQKTSNVIEAIVHSLDQGAISLQEQNIIFFDDKKRYMDSSVALTEKINILLSADVKVKAMIEAEVNPEHKKFLQEEVLFVLEQHIQDIQQTNLVSQQGVLALDILVKNNKELIKGVSRTKNVTIAALGIGATIAVGLNEQKKVLDTITAINDGTSDLLASNGMLLKTQGAAIQKQAAGAMLNMEKMTAAINDTIAAIEDVETFKQKALPEMSNTIAKFSEMSAVIDQKIQKLEKGAKVQIEGGK
jgi:uncharacterized protein YaaN involved in tellurite resistance